MGEVHPESTEGPYHLFDEEATQPGSSVQVGLSALFFVSENHLWESSALSLYLFPCDDTRGPPCIITLLTMSQLNDTVLQD